MQECIICFTEYQKDEFVKCFLNNCKCSFCYECAKTHIEISKNENRIPKCFYCTNYMVRSSFLDFPELLLEYNKCCLRELMNENGNDMSQIISLEKKMNELRNIRIEYINNNFPLAISFFANKFLKHKMRYHKNIKITKEENVVKKCMNLLCKGYLNSEYTCSICDSKFCKLCEDVLSDNHKCDENNLESIRLINTFVKCPKCFLAIQKSEGCNDMKCSNCNENFVYNSGKSGGNGNMHNTKIDLRENILLSIEYEDYLIKKGLLEEVIKLENKKTDFNFNKTNNIIKKYIKNEKEEAEAEHNIAKEFEKYVIFNLKIKNYNKLMITLDQEIKKENLDFDNFKEIMLKYNNL